MLSRLLLFCFFLFAVFALVAGQQFFSLVVGFDALNIVAAAALFISIIFRYSTALSLGVAGGFLLDYFSFSPGTASVPLVAAVILTNALFIRFFTNRSLWTLLLLGGAGTAAAVFLRAVLLWNFVSFFDALGAQLFIHSALFIIFFFIAKSGSSHLKPYIIIRHN